MCGVKDRVCSLVTKIILILNSSLNTFNDDYQVDVSVNTNEISVAVFLIIIFSIFIIYRDNNDNNRIMIFTIIILKEFIKIFFQSFFLLCYLIFTLS